MSYRIHCVDRTSIWRFRANFSVQTGVDLSDRYTRIKSYQVFPCRMAPTGIYMYYTRRKIEGNKTPKCNRYLRVSYVLRCDVTSREVKEARRPYTCSRPSAFEENRTRNQGRFINDSGAHKKEIKTEIVQHIFLAFSTPVVVTYQVYVYISGISTVRCHPQRRKHERYSWVSAVFMSAIKTYCRELSTVYFSLLP